MSRISLHRPRRPRAVSDRPANDTRLLPNPHSLNPHYTRCPKAERPPPPQRSIIVPLGPSDRLWKVPGQKLACPFQGPLPSARPTYPAHHPRPLRRRPRARCHAAQQGHCAQRLRRRSPRRAHSTQRRYRVHAPIPPHGRALLVVETAPHRDFLASPPHFLRSTGLSQSRRRSGTSAVAGPHASVEASPSYCATVRDLPSPPSPVFSVIPAEADRRCAKA